MNLTEEDVKAILARLPREEKEMLLRLPMKETLVILEMHHCFPDSVRVEELPTRED